jgi:hypothetical protein
MSALTNASQPPLAQRVYAGGRPRHWDFTHHQPPHLLLHQPVETKEHNMSRKPLVILIGADKGGVGKTTCARALSDYLQARGANAKLFDSEYPAGDLKRFAPSATVVDIAKTAGQMCVFDTIDGVTAVDIRAGQFSQTLRALDEAKLLDDVRGGHLNLALLHVLGPTDRSLGEIAETAAIIGGGTKHFLVRNHINEGDFSEWEKDARFASQLRQMAAITITIPHLTADACDVLQKLGTTYDGFSRDPAQSRMLRGYVRSWLDTVWRDFDKVGFGDLVASAISERLQSVRPLQVA